MLESGHVKLRIGKKEKEKRSICQVGFLRECSRGETGEVKHFSKGQVPQSYDSFWWKTASFG